MRIWNIFSNPIEVNRLKSELQTTRHALRQALSQLDRVKLEAESWKKQAAKQIVNTSTKILSQAAADYIALLKKRLLCWETYGLIRHCQIIQTDLYDLSKCLTHSDATCPYSECKALREAYAEKLVGEHDN